MTTALDPADLLRRLPAGLAERTRPVGGGGVRRDAELVLYWTHHALRGHENPALDVAIAVGNELSKPVLVYQGLGGGHRFNSDRHHAFIMQGARDLQLELAGRGIAYAFHLSADPRAPTPLSSLARRAALVVTEDFPAPPFPCWYATWSRRLPVALWAVDSACVVPMQSVGGPFARAFEFRRATRDELARRVRRSWDDLAPASGPLQGELGFEPVDLLRASIPGLCAACRIDHGVPPVLHTVGGSAAGYARWERFAREGLAQYARLRNDAAVEPPRGVSRLSPYIHYGFVSPFRIAREAAERPSDGSKKFLDELLVWRELAHNVCFHERDPESLTALPRWARETLARHASDPRPETYTWEQLARGQTRDELWNAAQRSLLVHGELHNNLRMTWGKALLGWTRSPGDALRLLVDLNHRFALDGNDPSSYGGLLWCLGLFDRPFTPERPVAGTIRARPTDVHRRRLDLDAYRARVDRPTGGPPRRVAVVGAGIAGLTAARLLADHGHRVAVFDKGRGVGGRTSVRRRDGFSFDHGAPFFDARDARFRRFVESWAKAGVVAEWHGRLVAIRGGTAEDARPRRRFVGVGGMNALAVHLGEGLDVTTRTRVARMERSEDAWILEGERGVPLGEFTDVIIAVPAAQAAALLEGAGAERLAERARSCTFAPCWSVLAGFEGRVAAPFDGAIVRDAPLRWVARDGSKPGRPASEAWVLHASAEWSAGHLEDAPDEVAEPLLQTFEELVGGKLPRRIVTDAHRWRYALPTAPLGEGLMFDGGLRLAVCGDWCHGTRLEDAFLSGTAAAGRLLGALGPGGEGEAP